MNVSKSKLGKLSLSWYPARVAPRGLFLLLAVVWFILPLPTSLAGGPSYKKELKKWTRHDEVYQREDLYASIHWTATLQSADFLRTKVEEIIRIYDYDPAKAREVRQAELEKFGRYVSFYVSFYGYQYQFSDLSQKRNGWKLTLDVDGRQYEPVRFEKLDTRLRPLYQKLYPYSTVWANHYYVYFPKPDDFDRASRVALSVRGPLANSTLLW